MPLVPPPMRYLNKADRRGSMSLYVGIKASLLSIAAALIVGLAIWTGTALIAATATSTAHMKILPSIISMTTQQTSTKTKNGKDCQDKYVSYYMGRNDGSVLISQTSAQCTSVYEIPAEQGSIIIVP